MAPIDCVWRSKTGLKVTPPVVVFQMPPFGEHNFGTYRGQIKSPTRIGLFAFAYQDVSKHWNKARAKGKPLEAAIVIGCTPNLSYCSTARLPGSEYPFAGGIAGEPVELVRCKTVD